MFLFAGSYERFIFGFSASADCSEPQEIVKRYTFAAHKSAVKCLVAAGPYVVSGGADDLIHMYDMKAERDLGVLMNPCDGAVPCLEFYTPEGRSTPSHMLSGSADGAINIWRCRDWEHLKVMRGHRAAVNSMAVHPSGRLALSTARDNSIRMWNLAKGRCTYTAPLETEADEVAFLEGGETYFLIAGNRITVHGTSGEGGLLAAATAPRRILSAASQSDQLLLLGLEDGSVRVWDVRSSGWAGGWERAHGSRVRGMAIMQRGPDKLPTSLATASSDGTIKLWDTRKLGGGGGGAAGGGAPAATCTAQVSTNARLTCLAAVDPDATAPRRGPKPAAAAAAAAGKAAAPAAKKAKKDDAGGPGAKEPKAGSAAAAAAVAKGKQVAQPPAAAKQQQQQQQPGGSKAGSRQQQQQQQRKARGGGGGGGLDDDPGFEVVPADDGDDDDDEVYGGDDDEDDESDGSGSGDEDDDDEEGEEEEEEVGARAGSRGARQQRGAAAVGAAGGRLGGKRRVREEEEEEEEEEGRGRQGPGRGKRGRKGAGGDGGAGPSGRAQQQQGQQQRQQGGAVGKGKPKAQGEGQGQKGQQRVAKKAKMAGGQGGGGGSGDRGGLGSGAVKGRGGKGGLPVGHKKLGVGKPRHSLKQKARNGRD
ncbi:hypothetical protein PLESTB_000427800 [Pleodorina starrii]|uniref:Uncharacterized protein n=1 Tax=Pleodorina starrii TaxID=330485 RepID=A0A9W6BFB5_9CHLO|nr:hypothetical protein PLESTM_001696100 [Pleodorina starrii]GLC50750.1 hypothetical protein PLESTB_000427800 [Pleodorina starrii]GLC74343.1 hypothetical protein PLESTF_001501700 [Pleodorina starrii]